MGHEGERDSVFVALIAIGVVFFLAFEEAPDEESDGGHAEDGEEVFEHLGKVIGKREEVKGGEWGYAGGMVFELFIETDGSGLYEITEEVRRKARRHKGTEARRGEGDVGGSASSPDSGGGGGNSGDAETPSLALPQGGRESGGLCVVFVRHTSASIIIQENADPSAKRDLERWLDRLVPEGDAIYTHTAEGPDDMPAHVKAVLTASSVSIPMAEGELLLGTWQGIYLWEHRRARQRRRVVIWVG